MSGTGLMRPTISVGAKIQKEQYAGVIANLCQLGEESSTPLAASKATASGRHVE